MKYYIVYPYNTDLIRDSFKRHIAIQEVGVYTMVGQVMLKEKNSSEILCIKMD